MSIIRMLVLGSLFFLFVGCSDNSESTEANISGNFPAEQVARGKLVFEQHCAECHSQHGEGDPNWRQRDAEGKFPPPPLNGTGHAWHHPRALLMSIIKNGTKSQGGNMPAWQDRLSDQQIDDIIIWFQSQWPQELYNAWQRVDRESRDK
jgi:mono/diheme cytochrome c family protein